MWTIRFSCLAQQSSSTVSFIQYNFTAQDEGSYSMRINVSTYAYIPLIEFGMPLKWQLLVNANPTADPPPTPVPLSDEVKYLGVYLDPSNNNRKNTSYRVSQAVSASKLLKPLLSHSCLPPTWKLTVYRSIVLSILTYAMDSVLLTSRRISKLDATHYKSLRRIFKIKFSFYHRVLEPSAAQCSNQYLASLAYQTRKVITPSQLYSQQRLQLFGHIHRHPESIENRRAYMSSHAYTHIMTYKGPE